MERNRPRGTTLLLVLLLIVVMRVDNHVAVGKLQPLVLLMTKDALVVKDRDLNAINFITIAGGELQKVSLRGYTSYC